jgi:DNA-binding transcriptional ArsR family regulator
MREGLDPFASVGTSCVFFQLVLGRSTPKEISDALGNQQPPSVMEHLNRLRDLGVVERMEKEGKSQPYGINWRRFASEFLDRIYTPRLLRNALGLEEYRGMREEIERDLGVMREVVAGLRRSERFREILRGYFEGLARDMRSGLYPERTIWGAIYCFEESLEMAINSLGRAEDRETAEVVELLGRWNACLRRFRDHGPEAALERAIRGAGGGRQGSGGE